VAIRELDRTPSLATLYPKALLGFRKTGSSLPDTELVRTGVAVDPAHLAAYNTVCGFRLSDELPATYPHLLAFPLQMALMTEPGFPFPLLGMVHVANRITQHRALRLGEPLTIRVRAENLRPHEKGRQFDVVSEAWADGSLVWTDVSTYLRRGGGSPSGRRDQLAPPTPGAIWRVPGDIGRRYAEVSDDRNPIHLHPLTARLFGFPRAIAHGMWTKAHALAAFEGRLRSDAFTIDVRFKQPVLLPAKAGFTTWADGDGWAFELWSKAKPHLEGTITSL
jgi:hypothetical protein